MSLPVSVYFNDSIKKAFNAAMEYNAKQVDEYGKPILRDCIRKQHLQLFEVILRRLSQKFYKNTALGLPETPIVYCNNPALAEKLGCTEKTVYNLLERLIEAEFITKTFRGAKFQYAIEINEKLLTTKRKIDENDIDQRILNAEIEEAEIHIREEIEAAAPPAERKTLPHILKTENNNISLLSSAVETVEKTVSHPFKNRETLNRETPEKLTPPDQKNNPLVAPTPQINVKNDAEREEIRGMVSDLWAFTFTKLYSGVKFMSAGQIVTAQAYFAAALLQEPNKEARKKKLDEFTQRIYLAQNCAAKPGKYIPLPSRYFDKRNESGFKKTRQWLVERKENKARLQVIRDDYRYSVNLFRQFSKVCNSVDIMSITSYQRGIKALQATGQDELVTAYTSIVMDLFKQQEN